MRRALLKPKLVTREMAENDLRHFLEGPSLTIPLVLASNVAVTLSGFIWALHWAGWV